MIGLLAAQFWILDPLYAVLGTLLAWFYGVIADYGFAILMLTVAVRVVTLPLTAKQAKAQQSLQKVQPELKRLQAKYKNDKQKLNEEMMKFYKENHVNPFGSCLPLIIQMPVLLVLYRLIIGLSTATIVGAVITGGAVSGPLGAITVEGGKIDGGKVTNGVVTEGTLEDAKAVVDGRQVGTLADAEIRDGKIPSARILDGANQVATVTDISVQGGEKVGIPKHVPKDSALYEALRRSGGEMDSWAMDLSLSPASVKGADLLPYLILVLGVVGTGYLQQRQVTARAPKSGAGSTQMQMIGKIFPVMFGVISFTVPAGVVVYFLVSNIWQIGQQAFIFRNQPPLEDTKETKAAREPAKGGKLNTKDSAGTKATARASAKATAKAKRSAPPARSGAKTKKRGGRPADLRGTRPNAGAPPRGRKANSKNTPRSRRNSGGK